MAANEGAPPELKDFQIGCSWIPTTPAKPNSTTQAPICRNWHENDPGQPHWVESDQYTPLNHVSQANFCEMGKLPGDYMQTAPACCSRTNLVDISGRSNNWQATNFSVLEENLSSFDTWQASKAANSSVYGDVLCTPDKFLIKDDEKLTSMSFQKLLALADAGGNKEVIESALTDKSFIATSSFHPQSEHSQLENVTDFAATSSSSAPHFYSPSEGNQYTMGYVNSRLRGPVNLLGATFDAGLDIASVLTGVSSIPSRPSFDLNSPPRTVTNAAFSNMPFQFEPITPQKTNKAEYRQEPAVGDLRTHEVPAGKNAEKNKITSDGVMELHEKGEKSHLIVDQSSAATSTQLQENHKPDKGGTEDVDLSKTPQQKARRKKHRPKVIIEGQKKSTPKSSAKTPVPQETTKVKRAYVRRKGVTNPLGGETDRAESNNKESCSMDTPTGTRKYVRRNGMNKPEGEMDKSPSKTIDTPPPRVTRSSCRRSLNFNSDGQVGHESSSCCQSSNCNAESQSEKVNAQDQSNTVQCRQGMIKKNDMVPPHERAHSMNQIQEDNLSRPGEHSPSSPRPVEPLKDNMLGDQSVHTRGKCQIVFSDATHDKETNNVQVRMNPDGHRTLMSPSGSVCSSTYLTPERQVRGLKRPNMDAADESGICNRNETGAFYNFMQAYLPYFSQNVDKNNGIPGWHFPTIYKKKRTEKGHNMVAPSAQHMASTSVNHVKLDVNTLRGSCTNQFTSVTNQGASSGQCQVTNLLTNPAIDGTQNGRKVFEDLLALGPTERIRKKRSKGPTRLRDLASLLEICRQLPASKMGAATSSMKQHIAILHEPPTCMEALVADTRPMMTTKKRSKRSMLINSTVQNMYNQQKSATISTGPPLALTWRCMSTVDSIVEQLNQLDLNAESSQASAERRNAFMAYHTYYQEQHALVPHQRSGAVIPFDGSFDQGRRRRPRPKVDLDDETTRVWKLLLENINNEGIDGTDEEKTKWWEEERRVFNGRADSFIARMHLVQGDRRFSPWKGSVVDSVVGVFLTQNVSDHLSSSAFMSIAARYPLRSTTESAEFHEEKLGTEEVCVLDPEETYRLNSDILNQAVRGNNTKMHQDFEGDSIREANSINTAGNRVDGFFLKDKFGGQSPNTFKHGPVTSLETAAIKPTSLNEDRRDAEDTLSSQTTEISSQNSSDSPIVQTTERSDLPSTSEEEPTAGAAPNRFNSSTSFVKLLQMAGTVLQQGVYDEGCDKINSDENMQIQSERLALDLQNEGHLDNPVFPAETIAPRSKSTSCHVPNPGSQATESHLSQQNGKLFNSSNDKELCASDISELSSESASGTTYQKITVSLEAEPKFSITNATSSNNGQGAMNQKTVENQKYHVPAQSMFQDNYKMQEVSASPIYPQNLMDVTGSSSNIENIKNPEHKEVNSNKNDMETHRGKTIDGPKAKGGRPRKEKENPVDWDHLRKQTQVDGTERVRTANTMDSVDWDAVRCADVNEIAQTIKERGMNNMLAERIKDFLNRLVRDHGSIDLEWLRDVPPDKAKEYLLSIRGLGLKSVECVRLLTLHHLAFPVDTNVGRIAVRLGWVPLQPLPESLQLHLLELYPVLESIQKYLWPRLCKLDQRTLYELHYQMITFGKVFCTKSKPNCNACPMRGECRHFASAFASARLALPAPEEKSIVRATATENRTAGQNPIRSIDTLQLPSPEANQMNAKSGVSYSQPIIEEPPSPEPIIEVPATPEQASTEVLQCDIETAFNEDPDEIPTIQLNMEEFTHNLQKIMQQNTELQEDNMSKALVALTSEAASIPVPKLKNVSRLRTEHQVYELPDSHPLLERMDKREPDDPCPYLLAIWTPGETANSIELPERRCSSAESERLCTDETCSSCNSIREANSQTVRGTLLIPCRTAMRGSFPLNGTYFQVNEVFSDHESSLSPIDVPREWLWNLPRRTVYFGTSIPTIFKGLSTEGIQYCFWRGFVCVRGFDRKTRAPRPLIARLHFPASKLAKGKGKMDEN